MIVIIDYQAGNAISVLRALNYLGYDAEISDDPGMVGEAGRLIFPGVGAAGAAMVTLGRLGLDQALRDRIEAGVPFLGICLGYQLLFDYSHEDHATCLGVLPGAVVRFADGMRVGGEEQLLKIPHIGWNQVDFGLPHRLWQGIRPESEFYFVHSYYPVPAEGLACLYTEYGVRFASGVVRDSLLAVQFHPEKSGRPGLQLLDNFCRAEVQVQ